jgi:hypothetical protein
MKKRVSERDVRKRVRPITLWTVLVIAVPICLAGGWTCLAADCNGNRIDDRDDVASGTSEDCNSNGLPDECEAAPTSLALETSTVWVGQEPHALALGDLDNDGDLDVVLGNGGCLSYSVVTNDGGSLRRGRTVRVGREFVGTAVGDLDLDGDVDVVFSDFENELQVGLNDGRGSFGTLQSFRVGRSPFQVALADLDNDGDLDAITADVVSTGLTLFFNDGSAVFGGRTRVRTALGPRGMVVVDVDGDGDLDLATSNQSAGLEHRLSVHRGAGDGTFDRGDYYSASGVPNFLAAGDYDGDGLRDLVTVEQNQKASLFLNQGDGTFRRSTPIDLERTAVHVISTDLTGDGNLDLVTVAAMESLSVVPGDGTGSFGAPVFFPLGSDPLYVVAGDVDGDGVVDLVCNNHRGRSLSVFLNRSAAPVSEDFLETICTAADFGKLAAFSRVGGATDRVLRYVLPVREDAALLPALFQNTRRYSSDQEFLQTAFPERFAMLTSADFERLLGRRATRDYFAGALFRLLSSEAEAEQDARPDNSVVYGFSVLGGAVADSVETLTQNEVSLVHASLRDSFLLEPLVYYPDTVEARQAASGWVGTDFEILIDDVAVPAPAAFALKVAPDTVACGAFVSGRTAPEEYLVKSQVALVEGLIELPTSVERFEANLIEEVLVGPERERVTSSGPGVFRLSTRTFRDGSTTYSFEYEESFHLASGELLTMTFSDFAFPVREGQALAPTIVVDDDLLTNSIRLSVDPLHESPRFSGGIRGGAEERLIRYSSCRYETLPLWEVRAVLDDGTTLSLQERFLDEFVVFDAVPASLMRAEVVLGDRRQVVADYWRLVYSAARHNTRVHYWVVLNEPLAVDGIEGLVHAIELVGEDRLTMPAASYFGESLDVLAQRRVVSFQRERVSGARETTFRRGDVDADGRLALTDVLALLNHLFRGAVVPSCRKAADADDSGRLNIVDALTMVSQLFGQSSPLPEPSESCGVDPTADDLDCGSFPTCHEN